MNRTAPRRTAPRFRRSGLAQYRAPRSSSPDRRLARRGARTTTFAYDIVEGLTTEVGQRLAGTEAEARARDWAVAKLKSLGFANVHVEPFTIPVWLRGAETAEIVSPFPQKLVLTALGNSGATPPDRLTAQVVAFDSVDALKAAPDAAVRGKIVFVDHRMMPTQDGSGYGQFGAPRRQGPTIASNKGAIAIVVRSIGTDHHRNPHTGVQTFTDGAKPIPAAALSVPDAEQLSPHPQAWQAGDHAPDAHHRVSRGKAPSGNVVAEVPGRDPKAPILLVGGHLDSWDLGTGAIDDATGVAITTAAAKRIMNAGRPLRTIRVVWFGAEEPGGFGGIAYQKAHGSDRYAIAGESDFGADRIWRFGTKLSARRPRRLRAAAGRAGAARHRQERQGRADGTDVEPDDRRRGAMDFVKPGRHALFRLSTTRRTTRSTRSTPSSCGRMSPRGPPMLAVLSGGIEPEPKRPKRR